MQKRRVIFEISPSRLEMAVVRHSKVQAIQLQFFTRTEWPEPWSQSLDELREPIARFVREHRLQSADAWLVVRTATSCAGVSSAAKSLPAWSAEQSATLGLATLADSPTDAAIHGTQVIAVDSEGGTAPMRHVLAIGDTDAHLCALQELVQSAGLRVAGILPIEGAAIVDAARFVMARSLETTAALWVGDHCSVLAVGTGGNLKFVRTIGVGIESFADALTRPLRRPGAETASLCVPRAEARRLIASVGFPEPNAPIDGLDGYTGSSILPMLQPLVQRLGVEIKQSLRYAASGAASDQVRVFILGQGAAVGGIAKAISRQTGLECSLGASPASTDSGASGAIGVLASGTTVPTLLSLDAQAVATKRVMRRAVLVGLTATLALIGFEWVDTLQATESLRVRAVASQAMNVDERVEQTALDRARAHAAALDAATVRIHKALGEEPDAAGLLAAIAQALPEKIQLTGIEVLGETAQPRAAVRGKLEVTAGSDPAGPIRSFIAALNQVPVVAQIKLGRTARVNELGREYQTFEVTLNLIPVPAVSRMTLGSEAP